MATPTSNSIRNIVDLSSFDQSVATNLVNELDLLDNLEALLLEEITQMENTQSTH